MVRRQRSNPADLQRTGGETQPLYGRNSMLCFALLMATRTQVARRLNIASGEEGHAMNASFRHHDFVRISEADATWLTYCMGVDRPQ